MRMLPALALVLTACALIPAGAAAAAGGATPPTGAGTKPPATHRPKVVPSEVAFTPSLVSAPGVTLGMPAVGLSIEYPTMAQDLGAAPCPAPALAGELLRLGSPPIELAGVSQDDTVPAGAAPNPPSSWEAATLYSLPATFWSQLHCLLASAKDPLTIGLNVRTGQLAWATQMVEGAQSAATAGLSVSLGNEPDLYFLPNYAALDKPFAEEESARARLYVQLASYLRPAAGGAPLIGPELARPEAWRALLPGVLAQVHVQTVGVHMYPLTACGSPRAVTVKGLLSGRVAEAPTRLAWVVADARAAGLPAIISEANSASCGGLAGVSDGPAAAVWGVRFVLSALKTGFQEVRFHLSGNPYDPFIVQGGTIVPRPLETALAALGQWLPVGSSLRSVPGVRELLATAVTEPGGRIVLLLDNENELTRPLILRTSHSVTVSLLRSNAAGLAVATHAPTAGRLRLSLPRNSVAAIALAP
jgi:hypothetical protein